MKMYMKIDTKKFEGKIKNLLTSVATGSQEVVSNYTEELYAATLTEVPRDTETLASSAYKEVQKGFMHSKGLVGYGGNGDPCNPRTGQPASAYMVRVHEDLSMNHPGGGKAKYLEDPARRISDQYMGKKIPNFLARLASLFRGK